MLQLKLPDLKSAGYAAPISAEFSFKHLLASSKTFKDEVKKHNDEAKHSPNPKSDLPPPITLQTTRIIELLIPRKYKHYRKDVEALSPFVYLLLGIFYRYWSELDSVEGFKW